MSRFVKTALPMLAGATLFLCFHVGTWEAVTHLPGITAPPTRLHEGDGSANWFGNGTGAVCMFSFSLVLAIYVGKWLITQSGLSAPAAVFWYCLGVAASLPYIWFFIVLDWRNPFIYRITCWVYDPIAIWAIPTASFAWDVLKRAPWTLKAYCLRSFAEIVLIFPLWFVFWAYFSFFVLGGGWI